jgi:hypothetical protein
MVPMKDINHNKIFSKWELLNHSVPQGSILGPLLFLIYTNDFPLSINKIAKPILFADDISIIISNTNSNEFKSNISSVLKQIINWLNSNLLTLNCEKSRFLQFFLKEHKEIKMQLISSKSVITSINLPRFWE